MIYTQGLTLIECSQEDNVLSRGLLWWTTPNDGRRPGVVVLLDAAQRGLAEAFVDARWGVLLEESVSAR